MFVEADANASIHFGSSISGISAELSGTIFGRIANSDGQTFVDASLQANVKARANSPLLPDIEGEGTLNARIGRFRTPSSATTLGVKGTLTAVLRVHNSIVGDKDLLSS